MDLLTIEKAMEIGVELLVALVEAVSKNSSVQAALIQARSVIDEKIQIDNDVDAAANGIGK